jgi:hypothetical protein
VIVSFIARAFVVVSIRYKIKEYALKTSVQETPIAFPASLYWNFVEQNPID